ncbi:MAG: ABC transporter permease [Candidatus Tectomicrobia bacterium]|uniref:ABC transporter permease n=1 Tax=Tectimicrobiota bacterium TaxID=2528274 RepID=A0A933GKF2_UNCTE|nr:ABC transporter permease [Candidatus Tectomicrobia bacterium]
MVIFIFRRFIGGVVAIFLIVTVTFIIMHLVPGGPFDVEKTLPPKIKANVEAKFGLDKPLFLQYLLFLKGLSTGTFGPSYKYLGRDVRDILLETFPVSARLGFMALCFAVFFGILAGLLSAMKRGSLWDHFWMIFTTMGISSPSFVIAALLIMLLSFQLGWFPPALWEGWRYTILPALTLGWVPAAYIAMLTRSSMLEIMGKEFVMAARAKGLSEFRIVIKHIFKNSLIPVVTIMGPLLAALVTGSFVVEQIFSIPGMGKFFITAVTNRDYPLIMGTTIVYALILVIANFLVDISYALLDPRIKLLATETRRARR